MDTNISTDNSNHLTTTDNSVSITEEDFKSNIIKYQDFDEYTDTLYLYLDLNNKCKCCGQKISIELPKYVKINIDVPEYIKRKRNIEINKKLKERSKSWG